MRFRELFLAASIGAGLLLSHHGQAEDRMESIYGSLALSLNDFQSDCLGYWC